MASEKEFISEQVLLDRLNEFLDKVELLCIVCFYMGSHQKHSLNECTFVKNKCLKCFEVGHGTVNCKFKILPRNLCFICGMKGDINGVRIHSKEAFGKKCDSRGKDKVLPLLALIYLDHVKTKPSTKQSYGEWRDEQLGACHLYLTTITDWFAKYERSNYQQTPSQFLKKGTQIFGLVER